MSTLLESLPREAFHLLTSNCRYRFYGSSLLIIYDGASPSNGDSLSLQHSNPNDLGGAIDVRMIDFAHVSRVATGSTGSESPKHRPSLQVVGPRLVDEPEAGVSCSRQETHRQGSDAGFALGLANIIASLERLQLPHRCDAAGCPLNTELPVLATRRTVAEA